LDVAFVVKLGGLPMKPDRIWELISHVYDNVHAALWATLLAFVIYFGIFVIPKIPSLREQYERIRAQEIADENALYCKKLNMKARTQEFNECLLVLGNFRLKVEQRIYEENDDF
jgi:hypothetical protein